MRLAILLLATILVSGCVAAMQGTGQSRIEHENVYGPGVHSDQYGRPVTTQPIW